jgi:hypothetical protein
MDPRDRLRSLIAGVGCTICGHPLRADRIRILAQRDDLYFVELPCAGCEAATLGMVSVPDDAPGSLDIAPRGELDAYDEARLAGRPAVSADDVADMREFLAGYRGDILHLLRDGRSDHGPRGR